MYKIGEFIVYSNEGVCEVEDISELNNPRTNQLNNYYKLKPVQGSSNIFVPVDTSIFKRPIITVNEIEKIIKDIPLIDENEYDVKNVKKLQEHYKELLNTHQCIDTLTVMVSLNNKKINLMKNSKKLGQLEEKFFRISKDLIENEFSIALGISKKEAELYIKDKIFNIC